MLADFQQALADLVATPDRCQAIRDGNLGDLDRYDLSMTERGRLVAIALHRGMAANCAIYRSNRLTPLVINLPATCEALGADLRDVVDRFWEQFPTQDFVHFLVEADRFATFLESLDGLSTAATTSLASEAATIRARLAATTSST